MKLDRLGGWLTLVANLGVVGGLVLLALELRQNTQVVRAQAVTDLLTGQMSAETAMMGEDAAAAVVKALDSPATLTGEEIVEIWAYLNVAMLAVQQTHAMYTLGLATDEDWETATSSAANWLGFPFGRVWWRELKTNYPSDLVAEIDAVLVEADPHYWNRQFEGMKNGARELTAQ